jgi:hypothetical protein
MLRMSSWQNGYCTGLLSRGRSPPKSPRKFRAGTVQVRILSGAPPSKSSFDWIEFFAVFPNPEIGVGTFQYRFVLMPPPKADVGGHETWTR